MRLVKLIEEELSKSYIDYNKDLETNHMVHEISLNLSRKILKELKRINKTRKINKC